jgi:hypothetical protein
LYLAAPTLGDAFPLPLLYTCLCWSDLYPHRPRIRLFLVPQVLQLAMALAPRHPLSPIPTVALFLFAGSPAGHGARVHTFAWLVSRRDRPAGAVRMGCRIPQKIGPLWQNKSCLFLRRNPRQVQCGYGAASEHKHRTTVGR